MKKQSNKGWNRESCHRKSDGFDWVLFRAIKPTQYMRAKWRHDMLCLRHIYFVKDLFSLLVSLILSSYANELFYWWRGTHTHTQFGIQFSTLQIFQKNLMNFWLIEYFIVAADWCEGQWEGCNGQKQYQQMMSYLREPISLECVGILIVREWTYWILVRSEALPMNCRLSEHLQMLQLYSLTTIAVRVVRDDLFETLYTFVQRQLFTSSVWQFIGVYIESGDFCVLINKFYVDCVCDQTHWPNVLHIPYISMKFREISQRLQSMAYSEFISACEYSSAFDVQYNVTHKLNEIYVEWYGILCTDSESVSQHIHETHSMGNATRI